MEDLSHLFPGGDRISALVPTAQGSPGSLHSSRAAADTAPGSLPALSDDEPDRPGPHVDDTARPEASTLTRGEDAGLDGGRPMLRMGQWNDLGGGPRP